MYEFGIQNILLLSIQAHYGQLQHTKLAADICDLGLLIGENCASMSSPVFNKGLVEDIGLIQALHICEL